MVCKPSQLAETESIGAGSVTVHGEPAEVSWDWQLRWLPDARLHPALPRVLASQAARLLLRPPASLPLPHHRLLAGATHNPPSATVLHLRVACHAAGCCSARTPPAVAAAQALLRCCVGKLGQS